MARRKLFLVVAVSIAILIAATIAYYLFSREEKSSMVTPSPTITYTAQERVFVADLHKYVDMETKKSTERSLYENIDKDQPDLYTGTIREDSLSEKSLSSNQTIKTLIVDIKPSEVAYKITYISDPRGGRSSINIECAPKEEQLNSSAECKDVHHHE